MSNRCWLQTALLGASAILILCTIGCKTAQGPEGPIAYVAPQTLTVRRELAEKNSTAALLNHGDRVDVLETRRRFVKVRTSGGVEGWVDAAQLLTADQMAKIQEDSQRALKMPSEGSAGVFEPLNIHIEPSRQSPAFARIPDGASVQVLGQRLVARGNGPAKAPVFNIPKPESHRASRKKKEQSDFPFPRPKPPKAPAGADQLVAGAPKPVESAEPAKPPVLESWTLVRTKDRQVGWVLSRNLVMSIPDEVAQYAEGRRITSYFDLGEVVDEEKGPKHDWLWTTSSEAEPFDFDSWRVFIWNRRHHRYETSYRQRDVEGYFPVLVQSADAGSAARSFQLLVREDDGRLWLRTYSFDGVLIHAVGRTLYQPDGDKKMLLAQDSSSHQSKNGWLQASWNRLLQRFEGKHE